MMKIRVCRGCIEKVRRTETPGDFYFTWKIDVFGKQYGTKHAFTIISPKTEYGSKADCHKIMNDIIKELGYERII